MSPNLIHSDLIIRKITLFKVDESFFPMCPKGNNRVLEAKKTTFWSKYGLQDFIFLFLVELGTCLQNLIPTRGVEH